MSIISKVSLLILAMALASCASSDFAGGTKTKPVSKKPEKKTEKTTDETDQDDQSVDDDDGGDEADDSNADSGDVDEGSGTKDDGDLEEDGADALYEDLIESDDEIICSRTGARDVQINSGPVVSDTRDGASGGVPAFLSEVISFKLGDIKGNKLPVASYGQDDVVVLVPASTTIATLVTHFGGAKDVKVPKDAVLVYDAANPAFASGSLDDDGTITYRFDGGAAVTFPGGQKRKLSEVYDLAPKLTPHNDIRLTKLTKDIYYDKAAKAVSFRVALIPHGIGHVVLTSTIAPCQ